MLRCFSTVAQTGNLADAALRLGRTQSAVSMTLRQLEDHLGQRLFATERKNRLTPLGEEVLSLARGQLRSFDETLGAIEAAADAPRGLLRIASVPSVAALVVPPAIADLTRSQPGLKVHLRDMDTEQVLDALLRGQADLGLASGRPALNGVRQELLFEDAFGLVTASDHPLALQTEAPDLDQVLTARFLGNMLCSLIETPGVAAALSAPDVTVHNTLSLVAMVRGGDWVTVLPETVVRILPDALSFREIRGLTERRPVSLLVRDGARCPGLLDGFAGLLRTHAARLTAGSQTVPPSEPSSSASS